MMKGANLRGRVSRYLEKGRPPSAGPIDFEIRALGGGDTSALLLQELPPKQSSTMDERVAEILDEICRLEREKAFYEALTQEAMEHIMPMLRFHARGIYNAVEDTCRRLEESR